MFPSPSDSASGGTSRFVSSVDKGVFSKRLVMLGSGAPQGGAGTGEGVADGFKEGTLNQYGNTVLTLLATSLSRLANVASIALQPGGLNVDQYGNERLFNTPESIELRRRGAILILTPTARDELVAWQKTKPLSGRVSGARCQELVREFDNIFCPLGQPVISFIINLEYPIRDAAAIFDTRSQSSFVYGGMRGGAGNKYWGLGQFSVGTYDAIRRFGARVGVILPPREQQTVQDMIVATFLLALDNQAALRKARTRVCKESLYVTHQQGAGYAKPQPIPRHLHIKQSPESKRVIASLGYTFM